MSDQVLEILTDLQSRVTASAADVAALRTDMATLKGDVAELRGDIAPIRAQLDGLPVINRAVTVMQRDVRALRDDMTVLTAIVMRLDGSHVNLLQELHATHTQIVRMNNRITALENPLWRLEALAGGRTSSPLSSNGEAWGRRRPPAPSQP
jgi:predicted  nucleic acid-binding Zn-ribbon protein